MSFAPTARATRAGGWEFCFFARRENPVKTGGPPVGTRTHSVFRAYGGDYTGRRLGILLSCPDTQCLSRLRRGLHGQAGNFERKELPVVWPDRPLFSDCMEARSPFSVRPRNGSKGTALPSGKTVRERCPDVLMCDTILVACTWIAGREFQKADGKAGGLCEEAAAFSHESFKMGMAYFY